MDAAVGKITRSVAKIKEATARAAQEEDVEDDAQEAKREAAQRDEALSALVVSSFAGADLAQRLPLAKEQDVS